MGGTLIEAVLFDMDGTLLDSEVVTEAVVGRLLRERGVAENPLTVDQMHGVTWAQIGRQLMEHCPCLVNEPVADLLQERFHAEFLQTFPAEVPGAVQAVRAAAAVVPVGIVTSSNRETLEYVVDRLGLREEVRVMVCAEDCTRTKPDPQGYLLGAERLDRRPAACLVFEDSTAGLAAARNAGMRRIAISRAPRDGADMVIEDFTRLPQDFFVTMANEGMA